MNVRSWVLPGWMASWRFLHGREPLDDEMATAYTQSLYTGDPRNAQVAVNHVHAMTTVPTTLVADLANTHVPLLVMHGSDDVLVPADNGRKTAALAGGRLAELAGAGHMFFNDAIWHTIERALQQHFTNNTIERAKP